MVKYSNLSLNKKLIVTLGAIAVLSLVNFMYYTFSEAKQYEVLDKLAIQAEYTAKELSLIGSFQSNQIDKQVNQLKERLEKLNQQVHLFEQGGTFRINGEQFTVIPDVNSYRSNLQSLGNSLKECEQKLNRLGAESSEIQNIGTDRIEMYANSLNKKVHTSLLEKRDWIDMWQTIFFLLNILVVLISYFALKNYITNRVVSILPFFMNMANGHLGHKLEVRSNDEIGTLMGAFNKMNENLARIIQEIRLGADNIVSGSDEISSASQEMSEGANMQASSAQEIASAVEEMVANIQQNSDNAKETQIISMKAEKSMDVMASVSNESMDAIHNITSKINIINDIAFQTNILALNAAVEAARAQEHGKGFSVVAAEVRKLAERSKLASDEIAELSVQSNKTTEKALQLATELKPEVAKTSQLIQEVAAASSEQNTGADQINNGIQQMNDITQRNAAASEELASSAEEFSAQAEQLKEIISFFKIGEEIRGGSQSVLIEWGPRYKIGLETIDSQHKVLVDLINELYATFGKENTRKKQKEVLKELLDYTVYHFGVEEEFFAKFNYEDQKNHEIMHAKFVDKIKSFKKDFDAGDATISFDLIDFLKDWLINHILKSDKQYVSLLKEKGVR